ncbi:MAG TPA: Uma2 family endonuclease [Blastocatellia bacterium]|nr:Uma2 family endonuclease [Blastocatellia bacterium]HMV85338.1 Uma2 family endonuclease [Blastocatellia bacterium]HMX27996.1 Uma2 family endonuclease [Blastocatellia bacterium]HMY74029.1 Uma2 family endonuclease [Blastocatellia bacterium]HMZ20096.1 Uma2 family endonuclease [Blastocatellia bacterium]
MSIQAVPALDTLETKETARPTVPLFLPSGIGTLLLRLEEGRFSQADFEFFAAENSDLQLEMSKEGEMIVMMPTGFEGSKRNAKLTARLVIWADEEGSGIAVEATAGFILPNGAERSPDAAWVRKERCEAFTPAQREKFLPLCPDFVVELRSRTDRLKTVKAKMEEYIENGAQLGWLIDPIKRKVHIYRPGVPVEILDNPTEVSGEPLLKGFTLKLAGILD